MLGYETVRMAEAAAQLMSKDNNLRIHGDEQLAEWILPAFTNAVGAH